MKPNEDAPPPGDSRGFGLVEVLAALALTGVATLCLVRMFSSALLQHRLAAETTMSTVLAIERIEAYCALPSSSAKLTSTSPVVETLPGNYRRTTLMVANAPAPGSKTIKVTVSRGVSTRKVTLVAVRTQ